MSRDVKWAWIGRAMVGTLLGAVAWSAFCVYVLGEVEKWGPFQTFVLVALFWSAYGIYVTIVGLITDVIASFTGRKPPVNNLLQLLIYAAAIPAVDGIFRIWRPGDYDNDLVFWGLSLGVPWVVHGWLRTLLPRKQR